MQELSQWKQEIAMHLETRYSCYDFSNWDPWLQHGNQRQRQERKAFVAKVGRNPSPADLHIVAELDLPMLARSLLNQGADANAKNNDGLTPLHLAAANNASATAEILINQGANANDQTMMA